MAANETTPISFQEMDLSEEILKAVADMGFTEPSTIQQKTIPLMMSGADINAIAPTGTGKTCAFGIAMLEYRQLRDRRVQEMVLAPTRERAVQIGEELTKLAKYIKGCRIAVLYGGQSISKQMNAIRRNPQIVVATPGRLLDHMERGNIKLNAVHTMVLDEADEMLNMGFVKDVTGIIEKTPVDRQLVLFSATTNRDVLTIAWKYQQNPVEVTVEATKEDRPQITQYVIRTENAKKMDDLLYLLDADVYQRIMVFCSTKFMTDRVTSRLQKEGYDARCIHGDIRQSQRNETLTGYRKGKYQTLVATAVAATGTDVDDVEAVINYELPNENEYYLHRIGRTGRAHKHGVSFSLVTFQEGVRMEEILKYMQSAPTPLHFEGGILRKEDETPFFENI